MNANDQQLPNETVIDDAELTAAQGGLVRPIDESKLIDWLEQPPSPTWPVPPRDWTVA